MKNKDLGTEVVEEKQELPTGDEVEEGLELNRHPQSSEDEEETEEEAVETPTPEEPKKETSVQEDEDEIFMEGITEEPKVLSPETRARRIVSLTEDIEKATIRMAEIEPIAELANSKGFRTLVEEVKTQVHDKVNQEDIKTSKDGLKVLEAVLLTEKTVANFKFQFNDKKSSIKEWEGKIVELRAGQLTLLDAEQVEPSTEDGSDVLGEALNQTTNTSTAA